MEKRKLASIRRIKEICSIKDADAIEVAVVDGWHVVVKKGEFKPGDVCIYCEIDSWIPHEIAPFLSKGREPREYEGVKGERLRTVKLRGQVSQGLILPYDLVYQDFHEFVVGDDVTEFLGIKKWEAPIPACLAGQVKGAFPSFIRKTDEERIQNLDIEELVAEFGMQKFIVTEKLDGSSTTFSLNDGEFDVCSRNLSLYETENNTQWGIARKYDLKEKMKSVQERINVNFAIQGELIGEGIQKNRYGIKGQDFYMFNVFNITDQQYFSWDSVKEIADLLGLNVVPEIDISFNIEGKDTKDFLILAEGKSVLNPKTEREGLVFKTSANEVSFKAISNKFLMKE